MSYQSYDDASHDRRLGGDFYTEDDICRNAIPLNWCEEGWERCKPYDLSLPLFAEKGMEKGNFEPQMQAIETIPEFTQGGCAPEVPTDIYFRFAETKFEVNDTTADNLGNRLIGIFSNECTMHIIKTSLHKFSIKAESTNPAWFVFKVRIYSKAPSHIVEFTKYRGDTMAFHKFFRKVMGLFDGSAMEWVCNFTPPHSSQDKASIQPFIDMANNTSNPFLLAEAVSGLTTVVKHQCVLALCNHEVFTAFQAMLCTGGYNVLCPLAQLLSGLTEKIQSMPFFSDGKFWEALLAVVVGEETCGELKTQFACAVLSALAFGATHNQIDVLQTAIEAKGANGQIRQMLEEAARMAYLS